MQTVESVRYFMSSTFSPMRLRQKTKTTKHLQQNNRSQNKTEPQQQPQQPLLEISGDPILKKHSNTSSLMKSFSKVAEKKLEKNKYSLLLKSLGKDDTVKKEISPCKKPENENIKIIKHLLQSCHIDYVDSSHFESNTVLDSELVNTYGLRIESMKYEIPNKSSFQSDPKKQKEAKQTNFIKRAPRRSKIQSLKETKQTRQVKQIKQVKQVRQPHVNSQPTTGIPQQQRRQRTIEKFHPNQIKDLSKGLRFTDASSDNFPPRLRKYREFLFMINFSNDYYRPLQFQEYPAPIKFYIGRGNNAQLVRDIIKKRFWYVETDSSKQANLIWTQIKIQSVFDRQQIGQWQEQSEELTRMVTLPDLNSTAKGAKQFEPSEPLLKLLNQADFVAYNKHLNHLKKKDKIIQFDSKFRMLSSHMKKIEFDPKLTIHNHMPNNGFLGNKKAMFYCLRQYYRLHGQDVFKTVPLTFHIQTGLKDPQFKKFSALFSQRNKKSKPNIWIVKPGQFTNRGQGITCCNQLSSIHQLLSSSSKLQRTYIIQQYITRPLLYNGRKFDIRAYMLVTMSNGIMKGYWYQEGYVRTSCYKFNLAQLKDSMVHLTNDAVQKYCEDYGRYEDGNKLSYSDLQRYIDGLVKKDFFTTVYPQMKKIATQSIQSTYMFLDPSRRQNNFEIFGLDFMIDDQLKPWLLEINTNPCLQLSCGLLQRIIPVMLQNAFRIAVDPQFPPPDSFPWSQKHGVSESPALFNKFELVFDEKRDGPRLRQLYHGTNLIQQIGRAPQDKEEYPDDDTPAASTQLLS